MSKYALETNFGVTPGPRRIPVVTAVESTNDTPVWPMLTVGIVVAMVGLPSITSGILEVGTDLEVSVGSQRTATLGVTKTTDSVCVLSKEIFSKSSGSRLDSANKGIGD